MNPETVHKMKTLRGLQKRQQAPNSCSKTQHSNHSRDLCSAAVQAGWPFLSPTTTCAKTKNGYDDLSGWCSRVQANENLQRREHRFRKITWPLQQSEGLARRVLQSRLVARIKSEFRRLRHVPCGILRDAHVDRRVTSFLSEHNHFDKRLQIAPPCTESWRGSHGGMMLSRGQLLKITKERSGLDKA